MRRLRMSRPWKSVPSGAVALPPAIEKGGSNTPAPFTGSVGSYGAMKSAKMARGVRPPGMMSGISRGSRAALATALSAPVVRPAPTAVGVTMVAIVHLPHEPDSRVDEGVEDVHDQVDRDDHEAGHDHDALHERKVALEDAL